MRSSSTPFLRPLCLGLVLLASSSAEAEETKLLRYPDLFGETLVFTYAGDLWTAPVTGGDARHLTSHPGVEVFPRFSPDGEWIAFTGQIDGDEQVYVIPASGGIPEQLTFYPAVGPLPPRWGYDHLVYGWTPDSEAVVFRSARDGWDLGDSRLYTVPRTGGVPQALPMPVSGAGDLSPDGKAVVYSPLYRDFRHWKRYEGGWAQDLWIFDLETSEARQLTSHPRSDRDPMWIEDRIAFTSDRTGTLNLYAVSPSGGEPTALTTSTTWDVRWPSADPATNRIAYELAGELWVLDAATGNSARAPIRVPDDGLARRPSRVEVSHLVTGFTLSPQGHRAAFAARGEIFSVPVEHGTTRNLTRSSGAHDREPAWSPDGRQIAVISDRTGEEELWLLSQDGSVAPRQLTSGNTRRWYSPLWSPDGSHIALSDQKGRLVVVEVTSGASREVARDPAPFGLDPAWSPDGRHLAFSLADETGFRSLWLWSLGDAAPERITDELFDESSPAWDPNGNYLYYLSVRDFAPQIGSYEWNYVLDREVSVFALALREDTPHPFPPRSDEVVLDGASEEKGSSEKKSDPDAPTAVEIEREGLARRVTRIPLPADNYMGLEAVDGKLLVVKGGAFYYGRRSDVDTSLLVFDHETRESMTLVEGLQGLTVSADGKTLLASRRGGYELYDVPMTVTADSNTSKPGKVVSTGGLHMHRVPAEEWEQIFDEVWRRFRDFFYVENLHGYDWEALREQYRPLLAWVGHRSDLSYVMSEMIAELNVSHAYVAGGDLEIPDRPHAGLLGARFEADGPSGKLRITDIFSGHNEEPRYRSPLTEVGVDLGPGDLILAINGHEVTALDNPYALLRHAGDAPVELRVAEAENPSSSRLVRVDPIASEDDLLYLRWVETNRARTLDASQGRVGYLHVPDMGSAGIREFIKYFYGQVRKEGLVIDIRSNGGGNVSPMLIERLRRQVMMLDFERNREIPDTSPNVVFQGHLACLIDEDTASDGDQFAWVFRRAGLGPLIGKRTWGGVVGIYGRGSLIDGGSVSVPESGSTDPEGHWVIEGVGVEPDIEVENDPVALLEGRDPQLEAAIASILERIESDPRPLPSRPEAPVKTP